MRSRDDNWTAVARIRDAAITEFAANGVDGSTIRQIASSAGVSRGLVIHHFGSKDRLRVACDECIAGLIRDVKGGAMASGGGFDVTAAFRAVGDIRPPSIWLGRSLMARRTLPSWLTNLSPIRSSTLPPAWKPG
jgi:AcrR family transcriptional regulator